MGLKEYQRKRRFDVTSEPSGREEAPSKKPKALGYVIQKHRATALHYDFRLEWKGVLLSWAVPKGPSLDPSVKRMAMQVEDHPLEYAKFEGIIPAGEYGGGTVMVWDKGIWTPESPDVDAALKKGDLKFALRGKKLRGSWVLVRLRQRPGESRTSWLLIKHRDEHASSEDITEKEPRSVTSGRLLVEIARDDGGDLEKAASGDPPELLKKLLANPKLVTPPKKGKKSVWHSKKAMS
jgi:bifunctional non-homologous end joining protein LigD